MLRIGCWQRLSIFVVAVLVVVLAGACTSKPAPAATSKPADATASKPAPAAKPSQSITRIRFYASGAGTAPYMISHALADIVNKEHPWLRIDVYEFTGGDAPLQLLDNDLERRKDSIALSQDWSNSKALKGLAPFNHAIPSFRAIATYGWLCLGHAVSDPKIKTPADLKGKTGIHPPLATLNGALMMALIKNVWKIGDQIRLSGGDFAALAEAMQDKLADFTSIATTATPVTMKKTQTAPWSLQMATIPNIGFFNVSKEDVVKAGDAMGTPLRQVTIPAGTFAPTQQEVNGVVCSMGWWCHESMDETTIYEVTKAIVDSADRFAKYGAVGETVDGKYFGAVPVSDNTFHPGALRLYKERGLQVGVK